MVSLQTEGDKNLEHIKFLLKINNEEGFICRYDTLDTNLIEFRNRLTGTAYFNHDITFFRDGERIYEGYEARWEI